MVVDRKAFVNFICVLMDNKDVRKTVKHSMEGALICGTTCLVGGILAGPPGLAIGGTIGGLLAYIMKSDKFSSIGEVLQSLSNSQFEELVEEVTNVVEQIGVEDLELLPAVLDRDIKMKVINTVTNFIVKVLKMEIV